MNPQFDKAAFKETLKQWVDFETPTGDEERLTDFSSLVFHALEKTGANVTAHYKKGGPVLHAEYGTGESPRTL